MSVNSYGMGRSVPSVRKIIARELKLDAVIRPADYPLDRPYHDFWDKLDADSVVYYTALESLRNAHDAEVVIGESPNIYSVFAYGVDVVVDCSTGELTVCSLTDEDGVVFQIPEHHLARVLSIYQRALDYAKLSRLNDDELAERGLYVESFWHNGELYKDFYPLSDKPTQEERFVCTFGDKEEAVAEGFELVQFYDDCWQGMECYGHWTKTQQLIEYLLSKGVIKKAKSSYGYVRYEGDDGLTIIYTYDSGHNWSIYITPGELSGVMWSANSGFDESYLEYISSGVDASV